ncbi:MAG: hypothetical protein CMN77_18820 [Spirochaetaceae bacterium]|nr:hypothetical protein [Spirochaetaceae bacterium]
MEKSSILLCPGFASGLPASAIPSVKLKSGDPQKRDSGHLIRPQHRRKLVRGRSYERESSNHRL